MTPALSLPRVAAAPRFQPAWLWLLALVPGNALIAIDLARDVVRPATWAVRFVPALLVLAFVAWVHAAKRPLAVRLRKELRLVMLPALMLLVCSGEGLLVDAVPMTSPLTGLLRDGAWLTLLILPAATLTLPLSTEWERGTLGALVMSPGGARALGEKYAVGAALVVLSYFQFTLHHVDDRESWWFVTGAHVLALATVPTWFFLARKEATTLGLVSLVPFFVVMPVAFFLERFEVTVAVVSVYAVVTLAALPWAVRRGALALPLDEALARGGASKRFAFFPQPLAAELGAQRETMILAAVGWAGFVGTWLLGGHDEAPMVLGLLSALAAVLSPALAFAEADRLGTLEPLLVSRTRAEVFRLKAVTSLGVTMLFSIVVPLAAMAVTSSKWEPMPWLIGVSFVWCLGLVASVQARGAALGMTFGGGLAASAALTQFAVFVAVWLTAGSLGVGDHPSSGAFMAAAFISTAAIAVLVAWRKFVRLSSGRDTALGLAAAAFQCTVLAVAGLVG